MTQGIGRRNDVSCVSLVNFIVRAEIVGESRLRDAGMFLIIFASVTARGRALERERERKSCSFGHFRRRSVDDQAHVLFAFFSAATRTCKIDFAICNRRDICRRTRLSGYTFQTRVHSVGLAFSRVDPPCPPLDTFCFP